MAGGWPVGKTMRIHVTSVLVDDQDKALAFYTEVLGFVKKTEIPLGDARWLTVVSPDAPDGVELLLEPDGHPAVKPFKEALVGTASRTRRSPSTMSRRSSSGAHAQTRGAIANKASARGREVCSRAALRPRRQHARVRRSQSCPS